MHYGGFFSLGGGVLLIGFPQLNKKYHLCHNEQTQLHLNKISDVSFVAISLFNHPVLLNEVLLCI